MNGIKRTKLSENQKGLEGLPLQMLIIAIVLSIGLPVVYSSLKYYDTQRVMQQMESKAIFIGEKARQLQIHGEGNSDVLSFRLKDGIFRNIKYLELANESIRSQLKWKISGDLGGKRLIENNVPLVADDEPLRLGEGRHKLRLECKFGSPSGIDGKVLYVEVSLV